MKVLFDYPLGKAQGPLRELPFAFIENCQDAGNCLLAKK